MSTMPPLLSKKSAAPLPQEKTYYLKLCKLLVKVGRPVLQDVFDAIHLPTNLPGVLSTPKVQNELRQLQKKNVLYQSQMDILYPSSGGVSSTNFDISLLIILLRNICSIASPKWIRQPLPTDKSQVADIVRIRQCRNDLYHRTNLALTEGDFEKKWDEIKDALIRLGGGTKYEEDIQNIKVGSVDPEMEKHYHELLRSREEAETQQAEDINFIKTELKDVKQKLDESEPSVTIDIKTKFKLFAAGAVTIGWAAGCTYFLNRYKDDPEIVIDLVWHAIIPGTLAMGATVVGILRGSIIIKVKVTSIAALDYLWKSCIDGGEMEQNLHEVIVTEELIQQAPPGTDSVGISVTMSKDDYRRARDALLSDRCSSIPSHGKKDNNGASFVLSTMPPVLSKKSAPTLPEEKIYYLKLLKLCVEVGIPVLQDVFDVIHMPTNLPGVLSTPKVQKELRQLQKKNVLHQSQIDILNLARKGSVTSAAFDISLLIVLLRNFCNITSSPTDAVWNSEPSTADKSKAADIVRIRLCRNNLYHRTNLAVTESDFEKKWDEIKHALIRLGGGTKYEEDIQNIKFGSVDPEIEEHYHDLLRSREETERKTEETLDNLKTGQQNLKQKLDEVGEKLVYAEIIIKTTFKLFAAGTVTLGWAAGCTYFLNRYKDDPEIVTGLVQRAIIPGTLAWGVTVVGILRGSIIIKVKVTSLAALDYLWKSYGEGEMEENLQKVIVTDGLIQHAPHGTDGVEISVTMSEDEYQTARNTLLGECPVNIKSHNRERSLDLFQKKIMRKNNETEPSSTDTRQTAPSEKEKTGRQDLDEMVEDQMPKKCGGTKYEEDFQNIKVRSVNPKMEQHYAEIFRLRVEREKLKSGHEDLKHELEEIIEKHVNRITKFKLFAAGTVTLGWAAGCTYFLLRYKDDPEEVINLVRHALIPGTLAMGMTVAGLLWR